MNFTFSTILFFLVLSINLSAQPIASSYTINSKSNTYTLKILQKDKLSLLIYKNKKLIDKKTFSDSITKISIVDIDNDGNDDIAVGIIKLSRWSAVKGLKMYLYTIKDSHIVPMWRSSKLTSNLINFCFVKNDGKTDAYVVEKLSNNSYNLIRFKWKIFGLVYEGYILESQDSVVVFKKFNELLRTK